MKRSRAIILTSLVLAALAVQRAALAQWRPDGIPVATTPGEQYGTALVPDGSGGVIVGWFDTRGGPDEVDVYVSRFTASGTLAPGWPAHGLALCTAPGYQFLGGVITDGAGGAIAAWDDGRTYQDHEIFAQRFTLDGSVDPAWPPDGATAARRRRFPHSRSSRESAWCPTEQAVR